MSSVKNVNLVKGIFCIVFSAFCFALMGVFVRLSGDVPFMQKGFFRNIVALVIASCILFKERGSINIPAGALKYLFIRSAAGSFGIFGNFYAIDRINIADAAILNKMSPFFAVIFSYLILGEKIAPVPFIAVMVAFGGAMCVIKPGIHILESLPALVGFLGGMGAGIAYACVRKLGSMKMTGSLIVVFFSAFSTLVSIPFFIFDFSPMTLRQVLLLCGAGAAAAGGQFGITYAYYNAPARDISIYDYSQIIFSALLGYVLFGQIPDLLSFTGYSVIIMMAVLVFVYNKRTN